MFNTKLPVPIFNFSARDLCILGRKGDDDCQNLSEIGELVGAFVNDGRFGRCCVFLPLGHSQLATEIARLPSRPLVFAIPAGCCDTVAVILAALSGNDRQARLGLALIPGDIHTGTLPELTSSVHEACLHSRNRSKAVAFVRPAGGDVDSVAFEAIGTDRWTGLLKIGKSGLASDSDQFAVAMELGRFYQSHGPVILSSDHLFDMVRRLVSPLLSACASAMAVVRHADDVYFPNAGFLTLVSGQPLIQLLADDPSRMLLHPTGNLLRQDESGANNHKSGADGNGFPSIDNEIKGVLLWGSERLLMEDEGVQVMHLAIDPGKKVSRPVNEYQSVCWTILRGDAFVKNGPELRTAGRGESICIAKDAKHALTNIGTSPLIVCETRILAQSGGGMAGNPLARAV